MKRTKFPLEPRHMKVCDCSYILRKTDRLSRSMKAELKDRQAPSDRHSRFPRVGLQGIHVPPIENIK